ncbi:MAG: hypothetical protein WD336_05620 [Trueperaceae bacterium]
MSTFRKDPFGSAWVLISPERGLEASDFGSVGRSAELSPLSPGEDPSLREIDARRPSGSRRDGRDWRIRVLEAPGALLDDRPFEVAGEVPYLHALARGRQEIVVEHPDARARIERFPSEHLIELLRVWRERMAHLADDATIRHVQLVRNVGSLAGATYDHPHAMLLASPVPNRWVDEERSVAALHHREHGRCLFCDVIRHECEHRERLVASNDRYVAIAPWAAKTPFETWILPRRHASAFGAEPVNALPDLADLLRSVVRSLVTALDDPPYNLLLHAVPEVADGAYHWHIELLPRLTRKAGFDWSSGFFVNPTPPEDAARFLREASVLDEVG